jgi:hypothetical protein
MAAVRVGLTVRLFFLEVSWRGRLFGDCCNQAGTVRMRRDQCEELPALPAFASMLALPALSGDV